MAVTRWNDPFRELIALQERMNRAFESSLSQSQARGDEELFTGSWVPPVDIYETVGRLVLKAELPGFEEAVDKFGQTTYTGMQDVHF